MSSVTLLALAPRRLGVRPGSFRACGVLQEVLKVWWSPLRPTPSDSRLIRWEWLEKENTVSYVLGSALND